MTPSTLHYTDSRDKAYGVAGMAITHVALDGEDFFAGIDLDAPAGEHLIMSHDYGVRCNPRMSAKVVWEQTLRELRLTASLALANITCRRYLLAHMSVRPAELDALRDALRHDASVHLDMDGDEADSIFEECRSYADRLFRHHGVADIAHNFAGRLADRHQMSGREALEILASLGLQ